MNRRDFLKNATALSMAAGVATQLAEELHAQQRPAEKPATTGPAVKCGIIGLGTQGREILTSLAKLPGVEIAGICDTYTSPAYIKRTQQVAPKAAFSPDYRKILDDKTIKAVCVATPSHKHKQIVLDALAAGKHVYCEAPLAVDLAEARDIAKAGLAAKTILQPGLQYRCNKQHNHVQKFVYSAALGRTVAGRGQWSDKKSWRREAPTSERETELNWRLKKATSLGIPGEIGIHQFDVASWFLKALPVSVTGFGNVMFWTQAGMEVPDTVQIIMEYPKNLRYTYNATLANSYGGSYDVFQGSDCAMLIKDQRAWMFKETDSPLLGWEVYARKDKIGDDTGIALVADATQLIAQGKEPGKVGTDVTKTALYQALDKFIESARTGKKPIVGPAEGYQATVVAAKAHEAVMTGSKITFQKAWFDLS